MALLRTLYHAVSKKLADVSTGKRRSNKWHALEKEFIAAHSTCAACGTTDKLQVHHCHPFHLSPELELDPTNLITLCMKRETECHLLMGHGDSWRAYNPNVRQDAADALAGQKPRAQIVSEAKQNRLMQ